MAADIFLQVDLLTRLVAAAVLGAAVGVEREIHGHAAGMRTNLLVALGSAAFTVLSIHGFPSTDGAPVDTSRVAAQLVTGIGFLGAGAILKDGATVRGLTTAAGLWTVAGVGMAAGTGSYIVAFGVTVIAIVSLWPLNVIADWLRERGASSEPTD
ncbi:MAG: MgtC/SapB family protein [Chloroflexi bacterium]|nr:MgtC/SapB family protein [Chloroflexota bacterium]